MPRQPKLGKQKDKGYLYWGATIAGKRLRFGRVDQVEWAVANQEFLKALVSVAKEEKVVPLASSSTLIVEDLCALHNKWQLRSNDKKTAKNRLKFLDRFCCHFYRGQSVGVMPASAVTKEILEDYMRPLEHGWTSWNYCVAVKAAFNWAYREGLIEVNDLARYPNPSQPQADVSEATLITKAEVEWFFEKAEAYGATSILKALHATGARPGELCGAKVGDYISSAKQLRLLTWKNGKKTNTARLILLPDATAKTVTALCKKKGSGEPIFTGPNGAAWTVNRLEKIWRKIRDGEWREKKGGNFEQLSKEESEKRIKETAQREVLTLYDLRHLWISDALRQHVPIATVAKMAGTSVKMIEKTYGHFRSDDLAKIANAIADKR